MIITISNRVFRTFTTFVFVLFFGLTVFCQIELVQTFDEFEKKYLLNLDESKTYVVNFWATWCGPCVKELPYFEQLNEKYHGKEFQQILVSLDDPRKVDKKVIPFIKKNKIKSDVIVLADGKYNNWIDRIDPSWSGAIPITLFIKGDKRAFYEQEFHSMEELETELLKIK